MTAATQMKKATGIIVADGNRYWAEWNLRGDDEELIRAMPVQKTLAITTIRQHLDDYRTSTCVADLIRNRWPEWYIESVEWTPAQASQPQIAPVGEVANEVCSRQTGTGQRTRGPSAKIAEHSHSVALVRAVLERPFLEITEGLEMTTPITRRECLELLDLSLDKYKKDGDQAAYEAIKTEILRRYKPGFINTLMDDYDDEEQSGDYLY